MSAQVSTTVCMYRLHELGDCFLVTFTAEGSTSRMLIDCGSFRNSGASAARLDTITNAIARQLAGAPIDVVVGTHQHNDHLSGFVHCEQTFRKMGVEQVWLSWLDNPADRKAQKIGKAHHNLMLQLHAARGALRSALRASGSSRRAPRSLEILDDVLGFYGASAAGAAGVPVVPAEAVRILKEIGRKKPAYLTPGQTLAMPGLPAGSVRVHVLGPPRKDKDLHRANPRKGESYDHALASANLFAARLLDAAKPARGSSSPDADDYPFDARYRRARTGSRSAALDALVARYEARAGAWRTIDHDWMDQAESLALYLDTFTNNSSLVLAIELVASGKVLLFAADAQTGNWASWATVKWDDAHVSTDDLLARTVLYKVGHHASHNATLVSAFEQFATEDLVALIPVHKKDPNITKENGWKMPARKLFARLKAKTGGRVLQMDGINPPGCDPAKNPAKAAWRKVGITPRITDLAVEIDIP